MDCLHKININEHHFHQEKLQNADLFLPIFTGRTLDFINNFGFLGTFILLLFR